MQRFAIVGHRRWRWRRGGLPGSEQQQAERSRANKRPRRSGQAAKGSRAGAAQAAKGLEQMAKGLEAMASGAAARTRKPVDPVSFRDLQALFPDIDGWEKQSRPANESARRSAYSNAEVTYRKDDARIVIKIVDSGFNQLFFAPFTMLMQAGYEKETRRLREVDDDCRAARLGEVEHRAERRRAQRLRRQALPLSIEGNNLDDIKALHDVAGKIDVAKLAAMK